MRAALSIVIPTLNAEAGLPLVLSSLMEGLHAGLIRELVVSDGGSADETCAIARLAGAVVVTGAAGRGGQLARGAAATEGDWMLFLHADTELAAGWSAEVAQFVATQTLAGFGELAFRNAGLMARMTARGANLRATEFGLPYGDQALLISRGLYEEVGGYQELPLMEDVAMAKSLKGRLIPAGFQAITSPERYEKNGYVRQILRNWTLLARYRLGAAPEDLARRYRGS
jgi:rSAM/selenodomain-associated transferase 2